MAKNTEHKNAEPVEPKEKKTFSSLFAKKETEEPKEKKSLSSLFAKKETDSEPKEKKSFSSLFAKKEKPVFEEPPQVLEKQQHA